DFLYMKLVSFCPFRLEQAQKRYNLYIMWQHRDGYEDTMIWQDFDKASELIKTTEKIHKAIKKHLNAGLIIPKEKVPIFIKNAYEA
ncbi:MAG: hypothetical protein K6F69_07130, partial [Treponema sp.]|nr:hypothetical protein [Treponema sp.]